MGLDDALRDEESESRTTLGTASDRPVPLEEVGHFIGGDAWTSVFDGDHHVATRELPAQPDPITSPTELDRIAHEVSERLEHSCSITTHERIGKRMVCHELDGLARCPMLMCLEDFVDDLSGAFAAQVDRELAGLDARHVEQVSDQRGHSCRSSSRNLELLAKRPSSRILEHRRDREIDRRERISEVMRDHREHLLAGMDRVACSFVVSRVVDGERSPSCELLGELLLRDRVGSSQRSAVTEAQCTQDPVAHSQGRDDQRVEADGRRTIVARA